MSNKRSVRRAFTLPEVLVTIAIVAVLAAVIVPTVTQQISKGSESSIQSNVVNLRTGVTAFVSDVRRFPSRLQNIFTAITSANLALDGAAYGTASAGRWRGPYQAGTMKALSATARTDSLDFGLAYAIDSLIDTSYSADNGYLGVILGGVATDAAAFRIDSLIDGATGATAGNLRWTSTSSVPDDQRLILTIMGSR